MSTIVRCAPKTLMDINRHRPKFAGVGSRKTPDDVLEIMRRLSHCLYDKGWMGQSGDADKADTAFHEGAMRSSRYPELGFAAYLAWNGYEKKSTGERRFDDPTLGLYDASMFENWEAARDIAYNAREGFDGLDRGGIALHTRNAYQALSPSLMDPVQRMFCWAKPVTNGKVDGGTNTAVQLARMYSIPLTNLYFDRDREAVEKYLKDEGY